MQHLSALARHKLKIFAASAIILGVLILVLKLPGAPAAETLAPADSLPALAELEAEAPAEPSATAAQDGQVIVYVSGAVRAPDVYQLAKAARVKDLILAAGGFSADADPEQINLADHLTDGEHIQVPRQGETAPGSGGSDLAAGDTPSAAFDINTAGADELDGLPGIGQALAQRIIEYRAANGPFKSAEELRNVKGIGPALFEQIAPLIVVGP